jgi:predicted KAP-like P-loop ATPase
MWADNETSEDLLGFKVHADLLIDVIKDDKVLPVTIGVFGDWGSGKSSILKIVNSELSGNDGELKDDTLVLYFNGWVFEGYDDAKAALLESIIEKFEQHKTLGNKVKDETTKLIKSVKWMRVLGLGFKKIILPTAAAYFTGGLSIAPFLANEFSKIKPDELTSKLLGENSEDFLKDILKQQPEDDSTLVREFRNDFKKMIDKSSIKKLVVIIDDLDRCTPDRIIENLEAIKLFLNVEKTAFVIGADPRIVKHAIEFKYKTDKIEYANDPNSRNERIVKDYLEKLIQIPYNLPKLSDHEVETYMTLLYCQKELDDEFQNILQAFYKHRESNRYGTFGFGDIRTLINEDQQKKLNDSISLIASLSSIITEGLNGNPRQIKRFLNTFTLRRRLVAVAKLSDFKIDVLAKLMVLEYSEPDLFRRIYNLQSTQNGEPKEIGELESLVESSNLEALKSKFSEWSSEKIIRWLKVEPKLSNIDLRDYYWISRDQLSGSISGSSLVPPHIRILSKSLIDHGSGSILAGDISKLFSKTELEREMLFVLLEKELLKAPENDKVHKVFIELMAQKMNNSVQSYTRVLTQIDHDKVPFSLRNELRIAKNKNESVQGVIDLFRADTKIGKGLKQN